MKTILRRALTLCMVLALSLSLAVPAFAATVNVTGVSVDRTEVSLSPGQSVTLYATVEPSNATNAKVTWESNRKEVATVTDRGVVNAVKLGTADISVITNDGKYRAVCRVTVEENYASDLTVKPAGPVALQMGESVQLTASVTFAHEQSGLSRRVTWKSDAEKVATVSDEGWVTAVGEGTANIMAASRTAGKDGLPVYKVVTVNVGPKAMDPADDTLKLERTSVSREVGQYQTLILDVPLSVVNGGNDVTENYTMLYSWKDEEGNSLSNQATYPLTPVELGNRKLTCEVTAVSKTDATRLLTGSCAFAIRIEPGTVLGGTIASTDGPVTLDKLMDVAGQMSVIDQLVKGRDDQLTPAITGLKNVVFYPDQATGKAGSLAVKADTSYVLDGQAQGEWLDQVVFTPAAVGTYIIPFHAYGEKTWYGQLEVQVTGVQPADPGQPAPPADDTPQGMTCDSAGITFIGSDFFLAGDADPVASIVFGKPSAGRLLRDAALGSGVSDNGATYYTDSARNGDYHVSTLTYLPPAGFAGEVTIPVTCTARSGNITRDELKITVNHKTASARFADVNPENTGNWSADAVDFAYECGLVNGVDAVSFAPGATMNRAMLVTILYRAAGSPAMTVTTNFTDLKVNSYYFDAVVWASAMGIVNGVTDTTFQPEAPVTRQILATILYRYAGLFSQRQEAARNVLNRFVDRNQVQSFAEPGVAWAVSAGVINGTTDTTLSPNETATRAQVVVMLHRYLAG